MISRENSARHDGGSPAVSAGHTRVTVARPVGEGWTRRSKLAAVMPGGAFTAPEAVIDVPCTGTPTTLVILLHGIFGAPSDFNAVVQELSSGPSEGQSLFILRPSNRGKTREGAEACARRAYTQIERALKDHPRAGGLCRLVIVGHSFGGIYARVLIKLMVDGGMIGRRDGHTGLAPLFFCTVASPHLGVRRRAGSLLNAVAAAPVSLICGQTGTELILEDEAGLLEAMAKDPYIEALRLFKTRVLYGNVFWDLQVPLSTATLRSSNPYRGKKAGAGFSCPAPTSFPSIVELVEPEPVSEERAFDRDPRASILRQMLENLDGLGWQKYDCVLGIDAHNQIVGNSLFSAGRDVVRHLARHIARSCTDNI